MELNISQFPTEMLYGPDKIDLASVIPQVRKAIESFAEAGLTKEVESFGFAIAWPGIKLSNEEIWNNPEALVWFVGGWGDERERYVANAIRKMRPAARKGIATLDLRYGSEKAFTDIVESKEPDGTFTWGDFPYGGAALIEFHTMRFLGAVSGLREEEDHVVASLLLNLIAMQIYKANRCNL